MRVRLQPRVRCGSIMERLIQVSEPEALPERVALTVGEAVHWMVYWRRSKAFWHAQRIGSLRHYFRTRDAFWARQCDEATTHWEHANAQYWVYARQLARWEAGRA